jgi:hypothetical protein
MGKLINYLLTWRRSTNRENANIPMPNSKTTNFTEHHCFSWGSTCYMFLVRLSPTGGKNIMNLVNTKGSTPPLLFSKNKE